MWQMSISCFIRLKPPKQKVTTEPSVTMVAGYSDQMAKKHGSLACWPAAAFEALLSLGKHLKLHGNNQKNSFTDGWL